MKKLKYQSKLHYKNSKEGYETNIEPSQTIQGEASTISELIERYRNGIPLPNYQFEYIDSPLDLIDKRFRPAMDLEEFSELATEMQIKLNELKYLQEQQEQKEKQENIFVDDKEPKLDQSKKEDKNDR